jgi:hypothetical protein
MANWCTVSLAGLLTLVLFWFSALTDSALVFSSRPLTPLRVPFLSSLGELIIHAEGLLKFKAAGCVGITDSALAKFAEYDSCFVSCLSIDLSASPSTSLRVCVPVSVPVPALVLVSALSMSQKLKKRVPKKNETGDRDVC